MRNEFRRMDEGVDGVRDDVVRNRHQMEEDLRRVDENDNMVKEIVARKHEPPANRNATRGRQC